MHPLSGHLDKLPLFLEVVRAGSIRLAARRLRLSQPSVSRAIRTLESALEARLFVRESSGVRLTQKGQELFDFSSRMSHELDLLSSRLSENEEIREKLSIGTYESIAVYLFPEFLRYVSVTQRSLDLSIATASSAKLMDDLRHTRLDLIVSVNPKPHKEVRTTPLYEDEYGFFHSPSLEAGPGTPWISVFQAQDQNGRSIEAHLSSHRAKRFSCESFETVKALTLSRLGVGILPTRVVAEPIKSGQLVEAGGKSVYKRFGRHSVGVSTLKYREGDQAIVWVHRMLERFLKDRQTN